MRPDQHKKKRSAQYKKKHGIKEDEKTSESGSKSKKSGGKQPQKQDNVAKSVPGEKRQVAAQVRAQDQKRNSDSEDEQV